MALLDGLLDWWSFGDAAEEIANGALVGHFKDEFRALGVGVDGFHTPHDGVYGGNGTFSEFAGSLNETSEPAPSAWSCGDTRGILQTMNGADRIHPVIDPQVGHNANNRGFVSFGAAAVPWWSYSNFSLMIFAHGAGGYFIARTSAVSKHYLMGDSRISAGSGPRGWNIAAFYNTAPNPNPAEFTADGLHTLITTVFPGGGEWALEDMTGARRNLSCGPISDDHFDIIIITGDGSAIRSYVFDGEEYALYDEVAGVLGSANAGLSFGARDNTGVDDGAYPAPLHGAFDECLLWGRVLSQEEINTLAHACDANMRLRQRFLTVQPDAHNRFSRAVKIRGASGQTIPIDPAGFSTEENEPQGANVRALGQTAWYKWTAPSSHTVTFHTAEGHPADMWSAAPVELRPV